MKSRTLNSLKNIKIISVLYFLTMFIQFLSRTIFLKFMSIDYLGINGLFTNVLSMLNLVELGVGTAMSYALYKPCAENDVKQISQLMFFYKKAYTIIGIVILLLGVLLTPFLSFLIKTPPTNIGNIYIYYIMYVVNVSFSYFFTYKRSLIICDQKQYISSITTFFKNFFVCVIQIIVLYWTRNYYLYLLIQIIFTILENLVISLIADHYYPYLVDESSMPDSKTIKIIKKNIFAMFFHKIGSVIVTGTDNLIITKFVSLSATGLYSNYVVIISALNAFLSQLFSVITASVGNLIVKVNKTQAYVVFNRILFINFLIYLYLSIGMSVLFNDFIELWIGKQFTFSIDVVVAIALCFFSQGLRKTVLIFKDAGGLFWNDRYKPLLESVVNLIVSIPLTIKFGIIGTIIGTIITNIFIASLIEGYVLYKNYFNKKFMNYIKLITKYYIIYFINLFICYYVYSQINWKLNLFFCLILNICIISIVISGLILLFYYKKDELNYTISILKNNFIKVFKKINY